jgi:arylsulfatase A-like enzyme
VGEISRGSCSAERSAQEHAGGVTTDHGIPFPRAKCSVYEPGLETCLLLRWPGGGLTGGKVVDALVPHTDIFATLCEWAGVSPVPRNEGKSFAPLLRGDAYMPHEAIFAEMTFHDYTDPVRSVRTDGWKLIATSPTPVRLWTRHSSGSPGVRLPFRPARKPLTTPPSNCMT